MQLMYRMPKLRKYLNNKAGDKDKKILFFMSILLLKLKGKEFRRKPREINQKSPAKFPRQH